MHPIVATEQFPFLIVIDEIGLRLPLWKELYTFGSIDQGTYDPAAKGEFSYALSPTRESINYGGEVVGVNYDLPSGGLADWSLPSSARSCDTIRTEEVYVHVDTQKPHLCREITTKEGIPGLVLAGIGHPFESSVYPDSIIVLFRKERAMLIASLLEFEELEGKMDTLAAEHVKEYPDTEFPNPNWELLASKIAEMLDAEFRDPSAKVQDEFETLVRVAEEVQWH